MSAAEIAPCAHGRIMSIEILGVYDGVCYYECKGCKTVWHRFADGHSRHGLIDGILKNEGKYPRPCSDLPESESTND
jgi:hypothetical protein